MINEDTHGMNESMTDHESKSQDLNGPTYKNLDQLGQSADHVVRIYVSILSPSNFRTQWTLHFDHWPFELDKAGPNCKILSTKVTFLPYNYVIYS